MAINFNTLKERIESEFTDMNVVMSSQLHTMPRTLFKNLLDGGLNDDNIKTFGDNIFNLMLGDLERLGLQPAQAVNYISAILKGVRELADPNSDTKIGDVYNVFDAVYGNTLASKINNNTHIATLEADITQTPLQNYVEVGQDVGVNAIDDYKNIDKVVPEYMDKYLGLKFKTKDD